MKKSLKDLSSLLCRTNSGTTEARKIQPETRENFERGISPRKSNWRFNDRTKSPELSLYLRLYYNCKSGFTRDRPRQSKSDATTRFFPPSAKFTSGVHYHRLTLQRNISKALMTRKRGPPLLWLPTRVFWKNLRLWTHDWDHDRQQKCMLLRRIITEWRRSIASFSVYKVWNTWHMGLSWVCGTWSESCMALVRGQVSIILQPAYIKKRQANVVAQISQSIWTGWWSFYLIKKYQKLCWRGYFF